LIPLVEPENPVSQSASPTIGQTDDDDFSLHVLAADDEPINRMLVEQFLVIAGASPHLVCNGKEALEAHTKSPFPIILMDMQMPEMSGLEATRRIRAREVENGVENPVYIVALTAAATTREREKAREAGMDEFLTKPLQLEALKTVIKKYHTTHSPGG
jgi:CheY-like chemotaxis protein